MTYNSPIISNFQRLQHITTSQKCQEKYQTHMEKIIEFFIRILGKAGV
jgi:Asp-tRNA(Asn)/Glu-tRNA(Gln) amidotransferase C subunit